MSYLIYVAMFGTAAVLFLWLRDARIYFQTGLPGYRKAAWDGVGYGVLASIGGAFTLTMPNFELLGLGMILAAMYLQGRIEREKVWGNEDTFTRFIGSVPRSLANKK